MRRYLALLMAVVLSLPLLAVAGARAQSFTFTTVDVPNAVFTLARGIDSNGTVVGAYSDSSFVQHGFLRSPTGVFTVPIDFPSGSAVATLVLGIDPQGDTVVGVWLTNTTGHAFVMTIASQTFVSFDFPGSSGSNAVGMNRSGEIAGNYLDSAGIQHGYSATYNFQSMSVCCFQAINFPGAVLTRLEGLSDSGDIVGSYLGTDSKDHAFLLSGGSFSTLKVPGASSALGINNTQQIAGVFRNTKPVLFVPPEDVTVLLSIFGSSHGFLLAPNGTFTVVNFPGPHAIATGIFAINDSGAIAGVYMSPGFVFVEHGFVAVPSN
jgi:uncharacterized membrane protein